MLSPRSRIGEENDNNCWTIPQSSSTSPKSLHRDQYRKYKRRHRAESEQALNERKKHQKNREQNNWKSHSALESMNTAPTSITMISNLLLVDVARFGLEKMTRESKAIEQLLFAFGMIKNTKQRSRLPNLPTRQLFPVIRDTSKAIVALLAGKFKLQLKAHFFQSKSIVFNYLIFGECLI